MGCRSFPYGPAVTSAGGATSRSYAGPAKQRARGIGRNGVGLSRDRASAEGACRAPPPPPR